MKKLFLICLFQVAVLFADNLPPAPMGSFTVVAIPHTAPYVPVSELELDVLTEWVLHNQGIQKIAFVSHVGGVVGKSEQEQWERASRAFATLDGLIPYAISPGTQDREANWTLNYFQTFFPVERFNKQAWYAGYLKGNHNSYQRIEAEGTKLLFIHLENLPTDEVLTWAGQVMRAHSQYHVIITTHTFIGPSNSNPTELEISASTFTAPAGRNSPQDMWNKCFRQAPNLRIILSGSDGSIHSDYRRLQGDNGNTVHSLVQNYPDAYLRCYRFTPSKNQVQVYTYSPVLNRICTGTPLAPRPEQHAFTFQLPFKVL